MSGPVLVWEHLAAGFVQPLDEFLERAGDGYDAADFVEAADALQPLERPFRRPLGAGSAARDPGELRVVQPGLRPRGTRASRSRRSGHLGAVLRGCASASSRAPGAVSAGSLSAAPAPGTRCTPGSRPSSGPTVPPISRVAAAQSRRLPRCARPTDFMDALRGGRPGRLARPALVRARARLRARPVRPDRRLRPLRRLLRGSGEPPSSSGGSAMPRRRSAPPACAAPTSGRGRS